MPELLIVTQEANQSREKSTQEQGVLKDPGAGRGYFFDQLNERAWDVSRDSKNSLARAMHAYS